MAPWKVLLIVELMNQIKKMDFRPQSRLVLQGNMVVVLNKFTSRKLR